MSETCHHTAETSPAPFPEVKSRPGRFAARHSPLRGLAVLGFVLTLVLVPVVGCSSGSDGDTAGLKEGYYTAEAVSFDSQGWKRFMTIYVNQDRIVTVEYNAKNASGFLRSWDMDNMRRMNAESGTYPSKYARAYAVSLINRQDPAKIDAVPGAAGHLESFQRLAEAAVDRARKGDKSVAFVQLPETGREAIKIGEADLRGITPATAGGPPDEPAGRETLDAEPGSPDRAAPPRSTPQ